jgi:hypothetical protein
MGNPMGTKDTTRKFSFFPKTLASCVEPLTRPVFKEKGLAGSRVLTEWESIVGKNLAAHCLPEKLSFPAGKKTGGTLTISAENGFATELQHMQHVILERLATYFGYQAVVRIAISHTFLPVAPTQKAQPPAAKLPPGSSALADEVQDADLKAALQSLAKALEE